MEQFKIKSGKIHFTDPCYDDSVAQEALNGDWCFEVNSSHLPDISGFSVYHVDHRDATINKHYCCSVDSGQFGVFDESIYQNPGEYDTPGFYRDCCEITLENPRYGVVHGMGFVSSSGYGDGSYSVDIAEVDGQIVSVWVSFID